MRDLVLFIHFIATLARLLRPGGDRSIVAESLLLRHQLLILNRSRQRAPNLSASDRILAGWLARAKTRNEIIRVGVLQFFIAARFVNIAVSLPQYQFASHHSSYSPSAAVTDGYATWNGSSPERKHQRASRQGQKSQGRPNGSKAGAEPTFFAADFTAAIARESF